jgi:hypothetical protein
MRVQPHLPSRPLTAMVTSSSGRAFLACSVATRPAPPGSENQDIGVEGLYPVDGFVQRARVSASQAPPPIRNRPLTLDTVH